MMKKLTMLAMAVGALVAFAVPATAGAAQLTQGGVAVPVGATISATSTNAVTTITATGQTLSCTHVVVNGIVEANAGGTVKVGMDGANDKATGCTVSPPVTAVAVAPTFEELHLVGAGGTAKFSFSVTPPGCLQASGASAVTWTPGTDTVKITASLNGGCGPSHLTGSFTVLRNGAPVIVD